MKLNNKGFAITAVLYGLLILFVFLVGSYLLVLSAKKDRVEDIVNDIENNYRQEINMPLVEHINNLYKDSTKTEVANNGINYRYASAVNLMKDRFGGSSTTLDSGNLRYYGANPNNYIYFNCEKYPATNCEKWRIIGVFDNKVKIVKNDSIGKYLFNQYTFSDEITTTCHNDWSISSLSRDLSDYYNQFDSYTKNMITGTTYYLGGLDYLNDIYSDDIYIYERGGNTSKSCTGNTTWNGYISLMYPSDYGYATDFSSCSNTIGEYDKNGCYNNDWLYNKQTEWLITPNTSIDQYAFSIVNGGYIALDNGDGVREEPAEVRPTLYLSEDVIAVSGTGTEKNPYKININ